MLQSVFDIPIVLMGFVLTSDNIHEPNEKFHLPTFFNRIKTSIWFLSEFGLRMRKQKHKRYEKTRKIQLWINI